MANAVKVPNFKVNCNGNGNRLMMHVQLVVRLMLLGISLTLLLARGEFCGLKRNNLVASAEKAKAKQKANGAKPKTRRFF